MFFERESSQERGREKYRLWCVTGNMHVRGNEGVCVRVSVCASENDKEVCVSGIVCSVRVWVYESVGLSECVCVCVQESEREFFEKSDAVFFS